MDVSVLKSVLCVDILALWFLMSCEFLHLCVSPALTGGLGEARRGVPWAQEGTQGTKGTKRRRCVPWLLLGGAVGLVRRVRAVRPVGPVGPV